MRTFLSYLVVAIYAMFIVVTTLFIEQQTKGRDEGLIMSGIVLGTILFVLVASIVLFTFSFLKSMVDAITGKKKIKYDKEIEVTKTQYHEIMFVNAGMCAGRISDDGRCFVKLWEMQYKKDLQQILDNVE